MRRIALALLIPVMAVFVATLFVPTHAAGAQAPTTTIPEDRPETQPIIPLPNSGREPEVEGDPGSATQYVVLFGTMGGMIVIGLLVWRESKKNAANRTRLSEPRPESESAEASS